MSDSIKSILEHHRIVVFSSPSCPFCSDAINSLKNAGFDAHVVNATQDQRSSLLQMTGSRSVPNVWVNGKFIGGCNDGPEPWMGVKKLINNGKLKEMLQSS